MDTARLTSGEQPFFAASQWGCFLLLAALALVAIATAARALASGPTTTYEGVLGAVELRQSSPWRASYHVVVAGDSAPPVTLQLRNQGTILAHLQASAQPSWVRVKARDGIVLTLTDLAGGSAIAEPAAPQGLLLAAAIVPLLLLALFVWPWFSERPGAPVAQIFVLDNVEEEE